jgi:hypothetical protein
MANHGLFVGWNRPVTGRETVAVELFNSFISYLGKQQQAGAVESFEPVFMHPHGGDMNGFVIVRGDRTKLNQMIASDEWYDLLTRINLAVDGVGVIPAFIGQEVATQMTRYQRAIK